MGQPRLTARASTLARMTAPELLDEYEKTQARATYLQRLASEVSAELQCAGRDISETLMFITWHRLYDPRRVPASAPVVPTATDMEMEDDEAPALSGSLPADT